MPEQECGEAGSMRSEEDGWIQLARPDGRRGLWVRLTKISLELCAGREGDNHYARFNLGEPGTSPCLQAVEDCLLTLAWSMDLEADAIRGALEESCRGEDKEGGEKGAPGCSVESEPAPCECSKGQKE